MTYTADMKLADIKTEIANEFFNGNLDNAKTAARLVGHIGHKTTWLKLADQHRAIATMEDDSSTAKPAKDLKSGEVNTPYLNELVTLSEYCFYADDDTQKHRVKLSDGTTAYQSMTDLEKAWYKRQVRFVKWTDQPTTGTTVRVPYCDINDAPNKSVKTKRTRRNVHYKSRTMREIARLYSHEFNTLAA